MRRATLINLAVPQKTTPMMRNWRATRWKNNNEESHEGNGSLTMYCHPIATLLQNDRWLWHRLAPCPSFQSLEIIWIMAEEETLHLATMSAGKGKKQAGGGSVWTPGHLQYGFADFFALMHASDCFGWYVFIELCTWLISYHVAISIYFVHLSCRLICGCMGLHHSWGPLTGSFLQYWGAPNWVVWRNSFYPTITVHYTSSFSKPFTGKRNRTG